MATVRSARACTVVEVVLEVLLPVFPSVVPVDETAAVLLSRVPSATAAPTVTCTVNTVVALTFTVADRLQVTACPTAEQSVLEPVVLKVVPAGSVSVTVIPPVCTDGPLLVTVSV